MSYFGKVEQFDPSVEEFELYVERLELFFESNNVVDVEKKKAMFLQQMGAKVYKVIRSLVSPVLPSTKSYEELKTILTSHFTPVRSVMVEGFKFNNRNQREGETIVDYAEQLQSLANKCEFGAFLDRALRDRFVCGVKNEEIRKQLLNCDDDITFTKACKVARGLESAGDNARVVSALGEVNKVVQGQSRQSSSQQCQSRQGQSRQSQSRQSQHTKSHGSKTSQSHGNFSKCRRCGRQHDESTCPARQWTCYACQRSGHTSKMCRSRQKVKKVDQESSGSDQDVESDMGDIKKIQVIGKIDKPLIVRIPVNSKVIDMEVDSGAACSIISDKLYRKYFGDISLCKTQITLKSVFGGHGRVLGKITVPVEGNNTVHYLELVVVAMDMDGDTIPLLGRPWLNKLSPKWREDLSNLHLVVKSLNVFNSCNQVSELQREFPKVFSKDTTGNIEGFVADVVLKEGATPIFHKAYEVPYAVKALVGEELKRLEQNRVLKKVSRSQWASPLVVVPKKEKGSVRLCVDFKVTVNRFVDTEHYPLPRVDDIFASLGNAKVFTVLDLSNAYLQLKISEKAQEILTVNTHLGLYQFTRLPYGITSAPAIFQSVMDQVLCGIPKVKCYLDDVLIVDETLEGNKRTLKMVLKRLESHNIRINLGKCKFYKSEVEYLGHVIDSSGIHPHPNKVEAVVKAPAPSNLSQLQSYLGLLNFYNRFLPNLASEIKPLHKLLEKGSKWSWTADCQKAFELSKELLVGSQLLVPYDPEREMIVSCDASHYGVGAVLSHRIDGIEKPVMFVSSTLSKTEQGYAQVEKEALAIIFGVKRFHKFIFGHKFRLVSDHSSLRTILGSKKGIPTLAAARLQRWAIILSTYMYEIEYRKGKDLANADAMSRLPMPSKSVEEHRCQFSAVNWVCSEWNSKFAESPCTAKEIAHYSAQDIVISRVMLSTQQGWANGEVVDPGLKPYFSRRSELSIDENCLTWGNRVVIPERLRNHVLSLLHDQHPGVVRMKALARSHIWWPGIDNDIESMVLSCEACQLSRPSEKRGPLQNWPTPYRHWQRVHLDFAKLENTMLLILVDSYSKWLEVFVMKQTTAQNVIEKLRGVIATFGFPELLVSDNGPPFCSQELKIFCESNGIRLSHSPPYHPASNGLAERNVRTVKEVLTKYNIGTDKLDRGKNLTLQHRIDNFLLHFRNTPTTTTNSSPAEIMFKYKPRTKLSMLHPNVGVTLQKASAELMERRNQHLTSGVKEFLVGEKVLVKLTGPNKLPGIQWQKGVVKEKISRVTYLVSVDGRIKLSHCDHLKHSVLGNDYVTNVPNMYDTDYSDLIQKKRSDLVEQEVQGTPVKCKTPEVQVRSGGQVRSSPLRATMSIDTQSESTPVVRRSDRVRRMPIKLDL